MPENTEAQNEGQDRTFTQAELDAIVGDRLKRERAKYADYVDLKAKVEEYEASKQTYEDAVKRASEAEAKLGVIQAKADREALVNEVAAETKVPANLISMLSGKTKEQLLEQAEALKPQFATPIASDNGIGANVGNGDEGMVKVARMLFGDN